MTGKMKKPNDPVVRIPQAMQGYATKWDNIGPEGLMKLPDTPLVVGTPENRMRITIEGHNFLSSIRKGLTSRDSDERLWAAKTFLAIVERNGHLCSFLRESMDAPARAFSEALNKAFSIGDKELNVILKQIRTKVYTKPGPRHCMIFPVEEIQKHLGKESDDESK